MKDVEGMGSAVVSAFHSEAGPVSSGLYWLYEDKVRPLSDAEAWQSFARLVLI